MAEKSKIEWTDATWNPITGCSVVSPGCTNCYAMKLAGTRLQNRPSRKGLTIDSKAGPVWNGEVRFNEQWLDQPLRWKRPRMIFVCAHGDLFHESVPTEWIDKVFAVMALAPQHTFQVLTKRPERMRHYLAGLPSDARFHSTFRSCMIQEAAEALDQWTLPEGELLDSKFVLPLRNVWLGVSVEDQDRADERIPMLLETPAAVRWISAEPLLGPVKLARWLSIAWRCSSCRGYFNGPHKSTCPDCGFVGGWCGSHKFNGRGRPEHTVVPPQSGRGIDWVVTGGESGSDARPMHADWVRRIREDCAAAGVPFHFKQWGEWMPSCQRPFVPQPDPNKRKWLHANGTIRPCTDADAITREEAELEDPLPYTLVLKNGKRTNGRCLDGVIHDAFPQVPG